MYTLTPSLADGFSDVLVYIRQVFRRVYAVELSVRTVHILLDSALEFLSPKKRTG